MVVRYPISGYNPRTRVAIFAGTAVTFLERYSVRHEFRHLSEFSPERSALYSSGRLQTHVLPGDTTFGTKIAWKDKSMTTIRMDIKHRGHLEPHSSQIDMFTTCQHAIGFLRRGQSSPPLTISRMSVSLVAKKRQQIPTFLHGVLIIQRVMER